jgi:hypothetical protein
MNARIDSPERKAVLAASRDLASIRAAARFNHVGMRRMRWKVQGRICFTFQPYGTPYAERGSLGRVYLSEDGTLEQGTYMGFETDTVSELTSSMDMMITIGTDISLLEPETVDPLFRVMDSISIELAAEPFIEENVRNKDTGSLEVIVTTGYIPVYTPDPEVHDEPSLEEISQIEVPGLSPLLKSWLMFSAGVLSMIGSIISGVYSAGNTYRGFTIIAILLGTAAAIILFKAIRLNDKVLEENLLSVQLSGKLDSIRPHQPRRTS